MTSTDATASNPQSTMPSRKPTARSRALMSVVFGPWVQVLRRWGMCASEPMRGVSD
jgi:hypothetical protein